MVSKAYFCRQCHAARGRRDTMNGGRFRYHIENLELWQILFIQRWPKPKQRRCFYTSLATVTKSGACRYGCYMDCDFGASGPNVFRSSPCSTSCTPPDDL